MFIGSIRYNLDPFQQYDDRMLWNALEKAHIKELVGALVYVSCPGKVISSRAVPKGNQNINVRKHPSP